MHILRMKMGKRHHEDFKICKTMGSIGAATVEVFFKNEILHENTAKTIQ